MATVVAAASPEETAQITSIAEAWNPKTNSSDVPLFATKLGGETVCVFVEGARHSIKLELPTPNFSLAQAESLREWLDSEIRRKIRGKAFRRECGRSRCPFCPAPQEPPRSFSTQPCIQTQAHVFGNAPGTCALAVRLQRGRPMSGFVPGPRLYAEFLLGEAYFSPQAHSALKQWIDARGLLSSVEVCDVRADTVLSFLAASHALDPEPSPKGGADGIAGFKHLVVPALSKKVPPEEKRSLCAEEYCIPFEELRWSKTEVRPAPLRLASLDLETFKKEPKQGRILMCAIFMDTENWEGHTELRGTPAQAWHVLVTPGRSASEVRPPPNFQEGAQIHEVASEVALILEVAALLKKYDADIVTGYNIDSFDFWMLFERARELGCAPQFEAGLTRLKGHRATFMQLEKKSRQSGTKFVACYDMPGRTPVDMYAEVKARRQLSCYRLAHVALKLFVEDVFGQEAFGLAEEGRFREFEELLRKKGGTGVERVLKEFTKRDMHWTEIVPHHDGSPEERGTLADYCLQDAVLPMRLFKELRIAKSLAAKVSVCGIAPHHASTMMQQALLGCAFQRFCQFYRIF